MGRKITMRGKHAQYIEHRAANATPDADRDILLEGDEAIYREYAYGAPRQQEPESAQPAEAPTTDRPLLTADGEYVNTTEQPKSDTETLVNRLRPIFYNNEADVRLFLKETADMKPNDITDLVNRWVQDKRISDYGYSRKGPLWEILKDAGIYTKSRQNWNRRVY